MLTTKFRLFRLQGIGALIFVLPHLLAETYTISGGITVRMNRTHTENMCRTHYSHGMHDNCHKEVTSAVCIYLHYRTLGSHSGYGYQSHK